MRSASEISWTAPAGEQTALEGDPNAKLFLTKHHLGDVASNASTDCDLEMEELVKDDATEKPVAWLSGRPDLMSLINDTFEHDEGDRVAVICCGSMGLRKDLKAYVGAWVTKGRDIWWHDEYFAW